MNPLPANRRLLLLTLALGLATVAGCAADRWPRIDPSGEQILIFPGETPPVAPGQPIATPAPTAIDPFTGVAPIAAPAGNLPAPPAYASGTRRSCCPVDWLGGGPTPGGPAAPAPQDRLTLTPERVLAPVGSEVVLRAGVCASSGYLMTNRRIEWALDQQGVGQFVTIGDRGECDVLRWPWQRPNKIDNHYAIGYSTPFHTCLKRNLADPRDDIQIRPCDAWISVTSAAEGTSHVTAFAPSIGDWAARKSSTVIYWVDAQWTFPASTTVPAGQSHTLTTTVTRQTDGAPIAGWIVRYDVAGAGGARLGYEAGQTAEATTDSQAARAFRSIRPTRGVGSSTVDVTIIRPELPGRQGGAQINVGKGMATITWASDAPTMPAPGLPPIEAPREPAAPPVFETPLDRGTVTPPAPAGRPNLTVRLERNTPDPIQEGGKVAYTVVVQNTGDGTASNIVITDRFDSGLANQYDRSGKNEVVYEQMSDLRPGESDQVQLEFDVLQAGERRHEVTVTADGASDAYDRASFTADSIRPPMPDLRVEMVAGTRYTVGQTTDPEEIRGVVENVGSTVATNVVVRMIYDPVITPVLVENTVAGGRPTELPNGYEWVLPRLAPGERKLFRLQCQFTQQSARSRIAMFVSADGGAEKADDTFFEVLPVIGESPAEGGGVPAPGPATGLGLSVASTANPAQVGRRSTIQLFVRNNGTRTEQQVTVQFRIPTAIQLDLPQARAATAAMVLQDGTIQFAPIATLAPGQQESILIPYDPLQQGRYSIQARAVSTETPQGVSAQETLEIRGR